MKRIVLVVMVTLVMALILAVGGASAREDEAVSVQVRPTAQVIEGGAALLVTVKVACEPGFEVREAHVFAQQGATSNFGGIPVVCDGEGRVHEVRVSALDGQFGSGKASVSAFVLLLDPATGTTVQGQDARTVRVVEAR
jgi:hypothetical protein